MKNILIFAGTTEGRKVSEFLSKNNIKHTVCVATKYGEEMIEKNEFADIHCDRMDEGEIKSFLLEHTFDLVIDATHPYAFEVTRNIKQAIKEINGKVRYIRLMRDMGNNTDNEMIKYFNSNEECAKALTQTNGNILLTTGSKELSLYAENEAIKNRLFARVIPSEESISICNSLDITGKNIIAMQGPFTEGMNEALIDMYDISVMVTKQSGVTGGFFEKAEAAKKKNIPLFVIGLPESEEGISLNEVLKELKEEILTKEKTELTAQKESNPDSSKKTDSSDSNVFGIKNEISLIGIGMGDESLLTMEAKEAIESADVIFGATRLIDSASNQTAQKYPLYLSKDIIPKLTEIKESMDKFKTAILFSGDSSFYSGATSLYEALNAPEIKSGFNIRIIPGISSISYLASRIGVSYSDANILSIHGREIKNIAKRIAVSKKTFILLSGAKDINALSEKLKSEGLENLKLTVGRNLSYPDEEIKDITLDEAKTFDKDGVITLFIENHDAKKKRSTHGLKDNCFLRNTTPMTKEEVREVSICKLRLNDDSILFDIGSGTGSIAAECALLSADSEVIAIEKKDEASDLIEENIKKFNLENISLIRGSAPEALDGLKTPTHAFIGGSSGNLKEILDKLSLMNPSMRVVINAITIETLLEIKKIPELFKVKDFEIIQMQVSRANAAGDYHLMKAENGVWICSFDFDM